MSDDKISTPERFNKPLYVGLDFDDYAAERRPFTVTVAGAERHDGEAPYVYVVEDHSRELAWGQALAWHIVNQEDIDSYVVASESFDGVPPEDFKGHWNDLRPDAKRLARLESLTKEAKTKVDAFQAATDAFLDENEEVKEECQADWDRAKSEAEPGGWELVEDLAMLTPQ